MPNDATTTNNTAAAAAVADAAASHPPLKEEYMGNVGSNRSYDNLEHAETNARRRPATSTGSRNSSSSRGIGSGTTETTTTEAAAATTRGGSDGSSLVWLLSLLVVVAAAILFTDNPWSPFATTTVTTTTNASTTTATTTTKATTTPVTSKTTPSAPGVTAERLEELLCTHFYADIDPVHRGDVCERMAQILHDTWRNTEATQPDMASRVAIVGVPDAVSSSPERIDAFVTDWVAKTGVGLSRFPPTPTTITGTTPHAVLVYPLENLSAAEAVELLRRTCQLDAKQAASNRIMYLLVLSVSRARHYENADGVLRSLAKQWDLADPSLLSCWKPSLEAGRRPPHRAPKS